jgi:hypothetical protein
MKITRVKTLVADDKGRKKITEDNVLNFDPPPVYDALLDLYRESSGYRDETLTSRTIDDLAQAGSIHVNEQGDPEMIMGARATQSPDGSYCWHLSEVESEPLRIALRELRGTLRRLGRLDIVRQFQIDIAQADTIVERGRWRIVEAVSSAVSVDELRDSLSALIEE